MLEVRGWIATRRNCAGLGRAMSDSKTKEWLLNVLMLEGGEEALVELWTANDEGEPTG